MKVKQYLYIIAIVTISFCVVMFGQIRIDPDVDALTRPSDDSADILLLGIKSVWVNTVMRTNVRYYYGGLSRRNLNTDVTRQLNKAGVVVTGVKIADARILADIQLTTREETEFVAANISVSFFERIPLERIEQSVVKDFPIWGTTWHSQYTLLLHKSEISEEVPKHLRYLVGHFCKVFREAKTYERYLDQKKKKDQQKQ